MDIIKSGTAKFIDFEGYCNWYSGISIDEATAIMDKIKDLYEKKLDKLNDKKNRIRWNDKENAALRNAVESYFNCWAPFASSAFYGEKPPYEQTKAGIWEKDRIKNVARLKKLHLYEVEFGQTFNVLIWCDLYACLYLGNPNNCVIIHEPSKWLEYIPVPDYSELTPAELRLRLSAPAYQGEKAMIPTSAQDVVTGAALSADMDSAQSKLDALEAESERIKKAEEGVLAEMKAELDAIEQKLRAKQEEMMAELKAKMDEANALKKQLESQIYLLDAQIYAIRCYAGEVVNFAHIRTGKNAPNDEPIVIHQKLRFLDEELGRLASLYTLDWDDVDKFELFLRHHPEALTVFAPNERCITLVRLSKTGTLIARDDKDPYSNLLKDYDYYHGTTVGIIIRNGENLYMGWTDESRVHIADDLIVSQVTTETTPYKEEESSRLFHSEMVAEREKEQQERNRKELLDEIISRTFVYNILQGIVDNSDILPLPKGVTLNKQSEYVQYAVADKWLKDTRFGSFTEIIKKGNERVTKGDMLLTTQRISAVQSSVFGGRAYGLGTWENNRGRGDRNITHDCSISDCTLYKANLVEWDKPYERFEIALHSSSWTIGEGERYKDSWSKTTLNDRDFYWYVRGVEPTTNEAGELVYTVGKVDEDGNYTKWVDNTFNNDRIIDYTIKKRWTIHTRHVYVSCEKEDAKWRGTEARANVEVMDGEFINLMYLDSVLLEWVINNRELGGWNVGGAHANYAFAIRYLNMALEHVRKRERVEEENIDAVDESICKNPEWPHILTEFKLEKQVREITPYQAKRFAKWYAENGKG